MGVQLDTSMSNAIPVHQLRAPQRWLLLELLTQEGDGEDALHIHVLEQHPEAWSGTEEDNGAPWLTGNRLEIAKELCQLGLCRWLAVDLVTFTPMGRCVAENLAQRVIYGRFAQAS